MRYEIATLRVPLGAMPKAIAGVGRYTTSGSAHGVLLGCAWQAALVERSKLSPLVALLHSIDGPPRITHIWPYANIDARFELRADAVAKGIWPPKGAPDWLTGEIQSTIALPTAISPLT